MSTETPTNADVRAHFALSALPFTREIDPRDRFTLPVFDQPLAHLQRAVESRQSCALIAPSGAGKTLLLRTLARRLPEARYRVHDVKVTSLSKRDFCREVATACGLEPAGTYPSLVRKLQSRFLAQSDDEGLRPVLLLDEA
ncbi:MAG: AAA family ATPase, partial [Myxococcota bacterium]